MDDFKANSHKSKEVPPTLALPEKRVRKVVNGTAKVKKKNEIRKITDIFISEDAVNVKDYIIMDVLVPAVKKAMSDIIKNGIDMLLYGESGRGKKNHAASNISYRSFYDRDDERRRDFASPPVRRGFDFDDIFFETRGQAEAALFQMEEIISVYGIVSVAELFEMADLGCPHTYNRYGWTDIRSAKSVPLRGGGYTLKLPKAIALN